MYRGSGKREAETGNSGLVVEFAKSQGVELPIETRRKQSKVHIVSAGLSRAEFVEIDDWGRASNTVTIRRNSWHHNH